MLPEFGCARAKVLRTLRIVHVYGDLVTGGMTSPHTLPKEETIREPCYQLQPGSRIQAGAPLKNGRNGLVVWILKWKVYPQPVIQEWRNGHQMAIKSYQIYGFKLKFDDQASNLAFFLQLADT